MSTFGEILQRLRTERHLKQADLVDKGLSQGLLSAYEANKRTPTYETLELLAKKLGVSVTAFFPDSEDEGLNQTVVTLIHQAELAESRQQWREALQCWDSALTVCLTHDLLNDVFRLRWRKTQALMELENFQDALNVLFSLLIQPEFTQSFSPQYEILRAIGFCSRHLGMVNQSVTFFKLAGEVVSPSDKRWLAMKINVGSGYLQLGAWEKAWNCYDIAAKQACKAGNGRMEAWALLGKTTARLDAGSLDSVQFDLNRATVLAKSVKDLDLLNAIEQNTLVILRMKGQVQQALAQLHRCWEINKTHSERLAELVQEKLLLAIASHDGYLGSVALQELERLEINGPLLARLGLTVSEYYLAFDEVHLARKFFFQAAKHYALWNYQDADHFNRLAEQLDERR